MKRLLAILVAAMLLWSCGGGGEEKEEPKAKSGEACETESATVCGTATGGGTEAVLMCIKTGNGNIWSESDVCTKAEYCSDEVKCVIDCDSAWLCEGRSCGDDGCGGSCGGCPVGSNCLAGQCQEYVCEPLCEGLECGPDGCGGSCGECVGNEVCMYPEFSCQPKADPCTPDCSEKACGPNNCGGSCGTCAEGTFCSQETLTCDIVLRSSPGVGKVAGRKWSSG